MIFKKNKHALLHIVSVVLTSSFLSACDLTEDKPYPTEWSSDDEWPSSSDLTFEGPSFQVASHIAGDNIVVSEMGVDASGNSLLVGHFYSDMNFGSQASPDTRDAGTTEDAFLVNLNQNGEIQWDWHVASTENVTQWGNDYVRAEGVAVDSEGSAYVIGHYSGSIDCDPSANDDVHATSAAGGTHRNNVFVTKLTSAGDYEWTKSYSGDAWDYGFGIVADSNDDIYITGNFTSTQIDFDPGVGEKNISKAGGSTPSEGADTFVSKLSKDGEEIWTQTFGMEGSGEWAGIHGYSSGHKLALNAYGSKLVLSGSFSSIIEFTPDDWAASGQHYTDDSSTEKLYIAQLDASTGAYEWSYEIDAWSDDVKESTWDGTDNAGSWVAVNAIGEVFVTAYYKGDANFNWVSTPSESSSNDLFVTKLSAFGVHQWTKTIGSEGDDRVGGIALDGLSSVYITGQYSGTVDFSTSFGLEDNHTTTGSSDAFITRINNDGSYAWTRTFESAAGGVGQGRAIAIEERRLLSAGSLTSTADFNPDAAVESWGVTDDGSAYLSELTLAE